MKEKVVTLERTVEQLLSILQHDRKLNAENDVMVHNSLATGRASVSRTCREVREANPSLASGMYWIDPDGQGVGEDAIYVHCNMDSGTSFLTFSKSYYLKNIDNYSCVTIYFQVRRLFCTILKQQRMWDTALILAATRKKSTIRQPVNK